MRICASALVFAFLLAVAPAAAQPGEDPSLNVYFGNLHSHTAYSDGSGTPDQAFRYARDEAGLDFLAITEHNHDGVRSDLGPIATHPNLYRGDDASLVSAAARFNEAGRFVAIYGQEFSTIARGNHANVLQVNSVIDERDAPNGDYGALLTQWLPAHADSFGLAPVVLLNHPAIASSENRMEYGRDDFDTVADWIAALDAYATLINLINGPSHTANGRPGSPSEREYRRYLNLGLHVGPTADQDNHLENWGAAAETRTGVIAASLSLESILDALRERRVYATQDRNLRVIAYIDGHLIGTRVTGSGAAGVASTFDVRVIVADDDEPDAAYRIEVFSDTVGGRNDAEVVARAEAAGNGEHVVADLPFTGVGQYVFLRLTQRSDDGVDKAWTAPVWFEE